MSIEAVRVISAAGSPSSRGMPKSTMATPLFPGPGKQPWCTSITSLNRACGWEDHRAVSTAGSQLPVRLVEISPEVMSALAVGDLRAASAELGVSLTEHFTGAELRGLWSYRVERRKLAPDQPQGRVWAVVSEPDGLVVGHGGFQAPADDQGSIEISYSVAPPSRQRGWGRRITAELLSRARAEGAKTVRASVAPGNVGSLAIITALGFHQTGERWDEEDGRELVFERPVPGAARR
jgi:ribosomal protein S18 acetylase RimI-like enzyme